MQTGKRFSWLQRLVVAGCVSLAFAPGVVLAQQTDSDRYATTARAPFSQEQLEQMLAPIALYPDALLSQILMAATYPAEIVEAAHWSRQHPELEGRHAANAVADEPWDPSVKSLLAFPRVLATMREQLQWTRDLGSSFLGQEPYVMQAIQELRRRAWAAGSLRSSERARVEVHGGEIIIESVDPRVAYVPYYDPRLAYGSWAYPAYPPVRWAPWPGYHVRPAYPSAFLWGPAVAVSSGVFFGAFDWHRRYAIVTHHHHYRDRVYDGGRRWEHRQHARAHEHRLQQEPHVGEQRELRRDAGQRELHRRSERAPQAQRREHARDRAGISVQERAEMRRGGVPDGARERSAQRRYDRDATAGRRGDAEPQAHREARSHERRIDAAREQRLQSGSASRGQSPREVRAPAPAARGFQNENRRAPVRRDRGDRGD